MKITKEYLKQVIKEELNNLEEASFLDKLANTARNVVSPIKRVSLSSTGAAAVSSDETLIRDVLSSKHADVVNGFKATVTNFLMPGKATSVANMFGNLKQRFPFGDKFYTSLQNYLGYSGKTTPGAANIEKFKKLIDDIKPGQTKKISETDVPGPLSNREKDASVRSTASKYGLSAGDAAKADDIDKALTTLATDKTNLTPDEMADVASKKGLGADKNILDKMTSSASAQQSSASPTTASSPVAKVPLALRRLRVK